MLTQASDPQHNQGPCWAVKQPEQPDRGHAPSCSKAVAMKCPEAAQAPGCSPSSDASCGMEYSCSMPTTPAAQEQQQQQEQECAAAEGAAPFAFVGWFAKCRGCGCMTAHEKLIKQADVPFCRRCQQTLHTACPAMQQKMVDTLLYVHHAWSNAGL